MGHILVDLDGTLAEYDGWKGPTHVGKPIPKMVERVKAWLAEGREVRIFTARAIAWETLSRGVRGFNSGRIYAGDTDAAGAAYNAIQKWCVEHIGQVLPITCIKDFQTMEIWDDRAVAVQKNTGDCAMFKENFE
jgi:hypothetical protein